MKCPTCPNAEEGTCCWKGGTWCLGVIPTDEQRVEPDPFALEVHDDPTPHMQCAACAHESRQDT